MRSRAVIGQSGFKMNQWNLGPTLSDSGVIGLIGIMSGTPNT